MPTSTLAPTASLLHQLRMSRGGTKLLLAGIPTDQFCTQPMPDGHHAMWIVGHLASTDDYFGKEFAGVASALPKSWHELFGMGSKPASDASRYPAPAEVLQALDDRRAPLEKWIEGLSPEQLAKSNGKDWAPYAPTVGDLPFFIAWHEGYHAGQLAAVRRSLGLPSAFG